MSVPIAVIHKITNVNAENHIQNIIQSIIWFLIILEAPLLLLHSEQMRLTTQCFFSHAAATWHCHFYESVPSTMNSLQQQKLLHSIHLKYQSRVM